MALTELMAVIEIVKLYLAIVAGYFAIKVYSRYGKEFYTSGKLLVFGCFVFSVASFFSFFQYFEATSIPFVVELLYALFLLLVILALRYELKAEKPLF